MAGHSVSHVYNVALCQSRWIIDTCATDHITPFLHLLHNVQTCGASLQLSNGDTALITHIGDLTLNSQFTLTNVFYFPTFTYNLLSVSKLLKDTTHQVHFLPNVFYIQDLTWKTTLEIGKEENRLYILQTTIGNKSECSSFGKALAITSGGDIVTISVQDVSSNLRHARMGHIPANVLKMLPVEL